MKLKTLLLLLGAIGGLAACGNNPTPTPSSEASSSVDPTIGKVTNLSFDKETGIVSFDPVEGATSYHVYAYQDDALSLDDYITDTSIDVVMLDFSGHIKMEIAACVGDRKGQASSIEFDLPKKMTDVLFEAEDYLFNFGPESLSNFRNNPLASGGAYVGGIDNCGQGIFIDYLCPIADTYEFVLDYLCEDVPGHLSIWVNNAYSGKFVCPEKTGYGGEGMFNPAQSKVLITLNEGWNTISIMKDGDAGDKWGSFVEMDCLRLKSNGKTYNPADLAKYGTEPAFHRLEAEMGSPRHKNRDTGVTESTNPCIKAHDELNFSNGFLMGNLDSQYDGVEWQVNCKKAGKYKVNMAYASAMDGCQATLFVSPKNRIALSHSADFKRMKGATIDLPKTEGWDHVVTATASAEIELSLEENFIYCIKMNGTDESIYQLDYIDLTYIGE